jgi:uncharacterized SAM-binding protein YcdF (DUF218 family)
VSGILRRWAGRLVAGTVVLALLVVGGTAVRVWQVARVDDRRPADALVVLGAAQYDGTPSSVFAARLQQAKDLYDSGVAPRIITVGGKQPGDVYTEAAAGKNFLVDEGVPAGAVVAVEVGSDTLQSIRAVADTMRADGLSSAVLVSDPWHSLRTRTMATDMGLDVHTSPTRQGPAVLTRDAQWHGIVRETGALLYYRLSHASAHFAATSNASG